MCRKAHRTICYTTVFLILFIVSTFLMPYSLYMQYSMPNNDEIIYDSASNPAYAEENGEYPTLHPSANDWTLIPADFLINPEFETDISGWVKNHIEDRGTNTEEWSSEYGGSAKIYVSGSPGAGDLSQQITRTLHKGERVVVKVHHTYMGSFSHWEVMVDGVGKIIKQNSAECNETIEWVVDQDYPAGTWFSLHCAAWPGSSTTWFMGIYLNTTQPQEDYKAFFDDFSEKHIYGWDFRDPALKDEWSIVTINGSDWLQHKYLEGVWGHTEGNTILTKTNVIDFSKDFILETRFISNYTNTEIGFLTFDESNRYDLGVWHDTNEIILLNANVPYTLTLNKPYVLRLVKQGNHYEVFLDGVKVVETNYSLSMKAKINLRSRGYYSQSCWALYDYVFYKEMAPEGAKRVLNIDDNKFLWINTSYLDWCLSNNSQMFIVKTGTEERNWMIYNSAWRSEVHYKEPSYYRGFDIYRYQILENNGTHSKVSLGKILEDTGYDRELMMDINLTVYSNGLIKVDTFLYNPENYYVHDYSHMLIIAAGGDRDKSNDYYYYSGATTEKQYPYDESSDAIYKWEVTPSNSSYIYLTTYDKKYNQGFAVIIDLNITATGWTDIEYGIGSVQSGYYWGGQTFIQWNHDPEQQPTSEFFYIYTIDSTVPYDPVENIVDWIVSKTKEEEPTMPSFTEGWALIPADFLINPEFETDISGWVKNHIEDRGTNTEEWSSEYGGSAKIYVSGSPGAGDLSQQITRTLHKGERVVVKVHHTYMGSFSHWEVMVNGVRKMVKQNSADCNETMEWVVDQDYPAGTWFSLHCAAWPGSSTTWFMGIYLNITRNESEFQSLLEDIYESYKDFIYSETALLAEMQAMAEYVLIKDNMTIHDAITDYIAGKITEYALSSILEESIKYCIDKFNDLLTIALKKIGYATEVIDRIINKIESIFNENVIKIVSDIITSIALYGIDILLMDVYVGVRKGYLHELYLSMFNYYSLSEPELKPEDINDVNDLSMAEYADYVWFLKSVANLFKNANDTPVINSRDGVIYFPLNWSLSVMRNIESIYREKKLFLLILEKAIAILSSALIQSAIYILPFSTMYTLTKTLIVHPAFSFANNILDEIRDLQILMFYGALNISSIFSSELHMLYNISTSVSKYLEYKSEIYELKNLKASADNQIQAWDTYIIGSSLPFESTIVVTYDESSKVHQVFDNDSVLLTNFESGIKTVWISQYNNLAAPLSLLVQSRSQSIDFRLPDVSIEVKDPSLTGYKIEITNNEAERIIFSYATPAVLIDWDVDVTSVWVEGHDSFEIDISVPSVIFLYVGVNLIFNKIAFPYGAMITLQESQHKIYLHVYDENGNHVGYNNVTGEIDLEISGCSYIDLQNGTIYINVPSSLSKYYVSIDATYAEEDLETYSLVVSVYRENSLVSSKTKNGTISRGEVTKYVVEISGSGTVFITEYSPEEGQPSELPIDLTHLVIIALLIVMVVYAIKKRKKKTAAPSPGYRPRESGESDWYWCYEQGLKKSTNNNCGLQIQI